MLRTPLAVAALLTTSTHAADHLKAFPKPEKGMSRHVLTLPKENDESILKLELVLGKTVETDLQNRYFFGGKIEEKVAEGWGYTYFVLPEIGPMAGTLMAIPPDAPKAERFIPIAGEPFLIRYNSKLPVVVYAPKDVEVRYRLWRGDEKTVPIEEG